MNQLSRVRLRRSAEKRADAASEDDNVSYEDNRRWKVFFLHHPGDSKIDSGEGILSAILAECKLRYTGLCEP